MTTNYVYVLLGVAFSLQLFGVTVCEQASVQEQLGEYYNSYRA